MHNSHIEMTKLSGILSRIYSPLFCHEETKGQGEMRARDEGTTNDNDAWGVRDEWENEAQT